MDLEKMSVLKLLSKIYNAIFHQAAPFVSLDHQDWVEKSKP